MASLLRENPLDDPDYEYTGPLSLAPFRQRNDETFEAAPGVPAMGLLNSDKDNRPGGTNLLGLYTGGVI